LDISSLNPKPYKYIDDLKTNIDKIKIIRKLHQKYLFVLIFTEKKAKSIKGYINEPYIVINLTNDISRYNKISREKK